MTDDLERRLRNFGFDDCDEEPAIVLNAARVAADEIARLRAENEALREALKPVADVDFLGAESTYQDDDLVLISVGSVRRARRALQEGSRHE